jgi:hypothetical protein
LRSSESFLCSFLIQIPITSAHIEISKIRNPIPLGYAGFYSVYYWMILTLIL